MKGGKRSREGSSRWKKINSKAVSTVYKRAVYSLVLLDSQIIMSVINEIFFFFYVW